MSDDCEPESEPAVLPRRRAVGLSEAVEDVRQKVGRNPLPRVANGDARLREQALDADLDDAARDRELHRVREHVPDDLLKPRRIARDVADARVERATKL